MFISTIDLLGTLQARLEGLIAAELSGPLFHRVAIYREPDLAKALQEMRLFQRRLCLLIPDGSDYSNEKPGRVLVTRCVRTVIALIADQQTASAQTAAMGDGGNTIGALVLKDTVIATLTGDTLGLTGCLVKPVGDQPLLVPEKNAPGRAAWSVELAIECGFAKAALARE